MIDQLSSESATRIRGMLFETLDVLAMVQSRPTHWQKLSSPLVCLTRLSIAEPTEFAATQGLHHFNLQLSSVVSVGWCNSGHRQSCLVAPGHVSLNVAHESFACTVHPVADNRALHVTLPPQWLEQLAYKELGFTVNRTTNLRPMLGSWHPRLKSTGLAVSAAILARAPGGQLEVDELTTALAVELLAASAGTSELNPRAKRLSYTQLRRIIECLSDAPGQAHRLSSLAELLDMSEFHFLRRFKATIGVPPHQYLTNLRIDRALLELTLTNTPITKIALELGFDSPSHFSDVFRRQIGCSPKAYRVARCSSK